MAVQVLRKYKVNTPIELNGVIVDDILLVGDNEYDDYAGDTYYDSFFNRESTGNIYTKDLGILLDKHILEVI